MRMIQFRGKTADGKFVRGLLIGENTIGVPKKNSYTKETYYVPLVVDKETIGQFTGILGSVGEEPIFEGDRVIDGQTETTVYWDDEKACFAVTDGEGFFHCTLEEFCPTERLGTIH